MAVQIISTKKFFTLQFKFSECFLKIIYRKFQKNIGKYKLPSFFQCLTLLQELEKNFWVSLEKKLFTLQFQTLTVRVLENVWKTL